MIGEVFSGYTIEAPLGAGAMGQVLRARGPKGEPAVVKVLAPELASDPALRARFGREAEAMSKLPPHPNVVAVLAVDVAPVPHLVMELVEGCSLRQRLQQGPLPAEQVIRYGLDAARGLAVVHAAGLIHRDVKPANLLLDVAQDRVLLADFGLAKDEFLSGLTAPGQLLGTSYYMAPEQWDEGLEEDTRIDVFALGVTLYELACGRPPFVGADMFEIAERALEGEHEPLEQVAEVPAALARAIDQALEPDPEERTPRADVLAADLEAVRSGGLISAPALVPWGASGRAEGEACFLLGRRRTTIGSDPDCELVLSGAGVAPRHAQLRRQGRGFSLVDLGSPRGTRLDGRRLEGPAEVHHGARIELGEVALRLHHPSAPPPEVYQDDVTRREVPAPLLEALAARGDPRAAGWLLEEADLSAPDAWVEGALAALLGPAPAAAAARAVGEARSARRPGALARLGALGLAGAQDPLSAWSHSPLAREGEQLGPAAGPPLVARVELPPSPEGRPRAPLELSLAERGVLLVGRDEKCGLRIPLRSVSRLQLTLRRVQRRWLAISEGRYGHVHHDGSPARSVEWLDPGCGLRLGEAELVLRPEGERALASAGLGAFRVPGEWFWALARARHPASASGLVALLYETRRAEELRAWAEALAPPGEAEALASAAEGLLAQRAAGARALLPQLLGGGAGLGAWASLLSQRRGELGPQLLPGGWTSATRPAAPV